MQEELSGYIEAIVFTQPENGFTVARVKESGKKDLTVITGYLPSLQPGESVKCKGTWKIHPAHGKQFDVGEYTVEMPTDVVGIQKYLESGLVKGIGPVFAKKIVEKYGDKTLSIIDDTPNKLLEIEGLGEKKLESLISCWKAQKSIRDVMIFLRAHGASPAFAQRIYKSYGDESIEKVKENPYKLAKEIFGIGFRVADAIALKLGFQLHSSKRLAAGIEFTLWELSTDGHTCFPKEDFLEVSKGMLQVEKELVEKELQNLLEKEFLIQRDGLIFLKPFFSYEKGIASELLRIVDERQHIRSIDSKKAALWAEEEMRIQFAKEQVEAVISALSNKVHIITGGPGTGKSTITNAILRVSEKLTNKILLAAPTGRAAKRMTQITRRKAFTIHAILEMDFASGGFKRGKDKPLDTDFLVIDEASMIDTPLLYSLLQAVPDGAKLLFVGDIDQLPSVGPGNILRDIIQSKAISVTKLKEIFRQAKGSKIITNAHRINQGEFPSLQTPEKSDFHFIEAETPEAIQEIILELVSKDIPKRWNFDSIDAIQVLSPMKKGMVGTELLNDQLQTLLNPSSSPLFRAGKKLHEKDKVMQIRNNYDKGVSNGDIGRIDSIDAKEGIVVVSFDSRFIEYQFSELDELVLAYATSVHKYQGSECPCIVMPVHTSHFKLLHRNLLYTAVTRGKKQVYLVGTKKAIAIAVGNNEVQKRFTGLEKTMIDTFLPDSKDELTLFKV